jgi:hypothetical protein
LLLTGDVTVTPTEPTADADEPDAADDVPDAPVVPVSRPGDVWAIGAHRLICGDATDRGRGRGADAGRCRALCFTSPPYGNQRDYTSGGIADWDGLMRGVFAHLPMAADGQVLVNLGLIHRDNEVIPYWDAWLGWMRSRAGGASRGTSGIRGRGCPATGRAASPRASSSFSTSTAKAASRTRSCPASTRAGIAPARRWLVHGDARQGWRSRRLDAQGPADAGHPHPRLGDPRDAPQGQDRQDIDHPAVFPVALPEFVIEAYTDEGDIVFEPFGGSGTTMLAASARAASAAAWRSRRSTWTSPSSASSRTTPVCRSRCWPQANPSTGRRRTRATLMPRCNGMNWLADKIEQWPTAKLLPYARNARTHSEEQVAQIAASIAEFGFTNPILAGSDGIIVAGHGPLAAAQKLGLEIVPVVVLDHLSRPSAGPWSSRTTASPRTRAGTTRCCGSNWKPCSWKASIWTSPASTPTRWPN